MCRIDRRRAAGSLLVLLALACTQQDQGARQDSASVANTTEQPGTFAREQFKQLNFLDGDWRGTMPNGNAFYERYRVTSDSTIQMYAFADSTMTQSTDSSRIYWRDGHIYNGEEGSRSVVAHMDSAGVHFVPDGASGYRYTWKQSGTGWTATLNPGAANTVVYEMKPVRP